MFIKLPVVSFEVIAVLDGPSSDAQELADAIRFALDIDQTSPAYGTFIDLIRDACSQLYELALQIENDILIMSSAYRSDGIYKHRSWLGVVAGNYHFNTGGQFALQSEAEGTVNRQQGQEARRILDKLVSYDWANIFGSITSLDELDFNESGAIGLQVGRYGAHLMVGDSIDGGRGIFWSVDPKIGLTLIGVQPREDMSWDIDQIVERGGYPEMISIESFAEEMLERLDSFTVERSLESAIQLPPFGSGQHKKALFMALHAEDWARARTILLRDEHCPYDHADAWMHQARSYLRSAGMRDQLRRWVETN